jgi:hypothetical protein
MTVGDIGDLVAALGFVHVMGRDQHRQPIGCQRVDLVPEIASRFWVDARGRLVQEQQLRIGQRAGAERQPLLPATGKLSGELRLAPRQAEAFYHVACSPLRVGHTIEPGDEFQVLAHRKILIQGKTLRHVADPALDLVGVSANVVAQTPALAAVGRQQSAEHADGGGLAAAVGAEEAVDGAALHLHRQIMHHLAPTKRFCQAPDIDRDVGYGSVRLGHCLSATGVLALRKTLIGWPTRNASGRAGRAWIR